MKNQIELALKDNPDLQEIVADKNVGDRVKLTVTFLVAEKDGERIVGSVEEVEHEELEPEPEETPAVKVAKRKQTEEDPEDGPSIKG